MSSPTVDIFRQATALNLEDAVRHGSLLRFESPCEVIVAGDIHGNRIGLTKIVNHAALGRHSDRKLILQEIIHGPVDPKTGQDRSSELLLRAARLKVNHPTQVFFLLGNHDVAQITGNEVMKNGHKLCEDFETGVRYSFADDEEVIPAIHDFLLSMPLTAVTPNKVLISHSLPSARTMDPALLDVLNRHFDRSDLPRKCAVYEWTWGREFTDEQLEGLCKVLDVEWFVLGHRHIKSGHEVQPPRILILNSDDAHGCILHLDGDSPTDLELLTAGVRPIATL